MNKIENNILKVIKQLSMKQANSREYKKYKKILSKKFLDIIHYKKTRTREESLKHFNDFKSSNEFQIPKNMKNTIKGFKND